MAILRACAPVSRVEFLRLRDRLSATFEACDTGGVDAVATLADTLGRQMATPYTDGVQVNPRPCVYPTGAEAALVAACARLGLDPEPYLGRMFAARDDEAAMLGGV